MKTHAHSLRFFLWLIVLSAIPHASSGANEVVLEAESGTLGAEIPATGTSPAYISTSTDNTGTSPATAARVARYSVTFPAAGGYRIFARVRVGSGGASDDSFYLGNGFGAKNPATANDWRTVNNFAGSGFANSFDDVLTTGGTAGTGVWKWIDASALAGINLTVPAGALVQTLDIGGRENGLDIDQFVFAPTTGTYTVDDLMALSVPPVVPPAVRVLQAEESQFGADLIQTSGSPTYLTVSTTNAAVPGSSARVMRFSANFSAPGVYRLFIRMRVGPGGADDDSLFIGNGFGTKDPAIADDWKMVNNFSGSGYSSSASVVEASSGGNAGANVWKWLDFSALANLTLSVQSGALAQTLDIGGRENGLDIDKIVFGPTGRSYTVNDLDTGAPGTSLSANPAFTAAIGESRQSIDGFGASSAWNVTPYSDALSDTLFSTTKGIGLSLIRLRIAPDGTTVELGTAQKAVARGAKAWASPWSPPAAWKSNNAINNGGTLLPEHYSDWAASMANFAQSMQNNGVPLVTISTQNEPNYTATWESCRWTPATMTTFIRDHLGPALASRGLTTRVLAPETISSIEFSSFANALINDPIARSFVSHLGLHCYGAEPNAFPAAAANGIRYWETEFTDDGADSDPGMDSALRVGTAIHKFLVESEGNAWHYWWLQNGSSTSTGSLTENNVLAKRGYAMGNWSRFVRPGHVRVRTYGSDPLFRVSAFVAPNSRRLTVVAINSDFEERLVPLTLTGGTAASLTPWVTSNARSLSARPAITPAVDGSYSLSLPARSITTFVSESMNRSPLTLALTGSSVAENLPSGSAVGTLSATDPDPGETYTYSLVSGTGSTHNSSFTILGNQLRIAAPLDFETGAAKSVRIRVTDAAGATFEQSYAINVINDPAEYADWSASLPVASRAPDLDPDGDSIPNLVAFALGGTAGQALPPEERPRIAGQKNLLYFEFPVATPTPSGISCHIERSEQIGDWSVIASKAGATPWTGPLPVETLPGPGASTIARVPAQAGPEGKVFYRLRVVQTSSTSNP